ncbi:CES5A family protein [Megaselia abdita]
MYWTVFLFCVFFRSSLQFTSDTLKVKLDHGGILVGRHLTTVHGRHVRAFQGVPYAQPPIGDLRFKAPVSHPSWEGEKLVTKSTPMCIQIDPYRHSSQIEGKEDCLYLNVYTPPLEDIKETGPLPVMVWFHGGGWQSGLSGDQLYGPKYLLDKNVILVSGNYRLGIFGFLSTETLDCPGNFGLKDQVEVLRWVNKNIKSFGGDPDSVTIFGESAGGASVAYHMFSEKSNKLFHRGIPQSGTNFNPWSIQLKDGRAVERALKLGEFTGCKGSLKEMMSCLRKLPAEKVISRFYDFFDWDIHPTIPFPPVVEPEHADAFLTSDPRKTEQKSLDKPMMIGFTSQEGIIFSAAMFNLGNQLETIKQQYRHLFPIILHYDHLTKSEQDSFTEEIDAFYFKNGHDYDNSNHENFTDVSLLLIYVFTIKNIISVELGCSYQCWSR